MKIGNPVMLVSLCCASLCAWGEPAPAGLGAVVTGTPAILPLDGVFHASVAITNAGSDVITFDTTPDEVVQAAATNSGAIARPRGSWFSITLYQDLDADGRIEGFRAGQKRIGISRTDSRITLHPGTAYAESFRFDLSAPCLSSVALREGPAGVKATLHLVIDGRPVEVAAREFPLILVPGKAAERAGAETTK